MSNLKILFWDVETAPMLAYIWRPSDDYVNSERLIHESWMICWAAKWAGQKKVHTGVVTPEEALEQDDSRICKDLADLIREADIVVAHNGDRFDLPVLNGRLLQMDLEPIGHVSSIDTLTLARRNFKLAYNKLDYLAESFGFGNKLKTNFALWKSAYFGDAKALEKMRKYNIKDVVLLEQVFEKMRPYVKSLKRLIEPDYDNQFACPSCGSEDLMKRGTLTTQSATYQKYQCNGCQRYSRSRTSFKPKFEVVPL